MVHASARGREDEMQRVGEPREPAGDEVVTLAGGQRAPPEERARVGLEDLHRAERPAEALRLERLEIGGRESAAEHLVDVAHLMPGRHQAQSEFRVLADAPFAPSAHLLERAAGAPASWFRAG